MRYCTRLAKKNSGESCVGVPGDDPVAYLVHDPLSEELQLCLVALHAQWVSRVCGKEDQGRKKT